MEKSAPKKENGGGKGEGRRGEGIREREGGENWDIVKLYFSFFFFFFLFFSFLFFSFLFFSFFLSFFMSCTFF